eukprot:ctg_204.g150
MLIAAMTPPTHDRLLCLQVAVAAAHRRPILVNHLQLDPPAACLPPRTRPLYRLGHHGGRRRQLAFARRRKARIANTDDNQLALPLAVRQVPKQAVAGAVPRRAYRPKARHAPLAARPVPYILIHAQPPTRLEDAGALAQLHHIDVAEFARTRYAVPRQLQPSQVIQLALVVDRPFAAALAPLLQLRRTHRLQALVVP